MLVRSVAELTAVWHRVREAAERGWPLGLLARVEGRLELRDSGCWEWTGCRGQGGYGMVRVNGRLVKTHRLMLGLMSGKPRGRLACHTCDNPPCVNPDHLYWGTAKQNSADRERRGRRRKLVGEAHPRAKLTAAQARALRADRRAGAKYAELDAKYGLTAGGAFDVCHRSWRSLC